MKRYTKTAIAFVPFKLAASVRTAYWERLAVYLIWVISLLLVNVTTQAATRTVTNTSDSGAGSLRQTIADASTGDTINFASSLDGQTITLTSGELLVEKNLTIVGLGANRLAVNGNASSRVLHIGSGTTVTISGLTITNGHATAYDPGGAYGGGIYNGGTATISNSAIAINSTEGGGGGIFTSASLTLTGCTIANNTASYLIYPFGANGGGIYNTGQLAIINCTISGNQVAGAGLDFGGGGIYSSSNFSVTISSSTIVFNSAGGPGNSRGGGVSANSVEMISTILALNQADNSYDGNCTIQTDGYNLIGDTDGIFIAPLSTDQVGTHAHPINPLIGSLSNNGGATYTHALQSGSPAINHGSPSAPPQDQRGYPRVSIPDVGAFEFGGVSHPAFFNGETTLGGGFYYLQFANGTPFGYYSYLSDQNFIYHIDLGYEYLFDANDASHGIFFYDFASSSFFYTSPSTFPYLYDFSLNAWLYYLPDFNNPGRYTHNPRWFYNFATGQWITL